MVLASHKSGHRRVAWFVNCVVADNVYAIHTQHPSLRSSSMFSNTKPSPGGSPAGGGSLYERRVQVRAIYSDNREVYDDTRGAHHNQ